jgi:hypothetical protein
MVRVPGGHAVKVACICEDPVNDQYIVRPIVKAALKSIGKPDAHVHVVTSPRTRGFEDMVSKLPDLLLRYGGESRAIVIVADLDCHDGDRSSRNKPRALEQAIAGCQRSDGAVRVLAQNEVEVWALWGSRGDLGAAWSVVRAECHPKEVFFEPILTSADRKMPDGGRSRLTTASLSGGWESVAGGCPELGPARAALALLCT